MFPFWLIFQVILTLTFATNDVTRLTKLINRATNEAATYEVRTDNSDLLRNISERVRDYGTFDFIIVGSGASGLALAGRLSEVRKWKILVLEAGGESDELAKIPYFSGLLSLSDINWGYTTTPQKNACLGRVNNQCPVVTAKTLGGATQASTNIFARGNYGDFDNWEALGNCGWSYEELLPYFKKVETFTINSDRKYHGFSGPITVSYVTPNSTIDNQVITASDRIGIRRNKDYNGATISGVSKLQYALRRGRVSSARNYISEPEDRYDSNLNITLNAFVTQILVHENNKTAYGLKFIRNGRLYVAKAKKEVILSAGSFNTPQLLKLSGIGPKDELKQFGINVIKDLPVGMSVRSQVIFNLYIKSNLNVPSSTVRDLVGDYLVGKGLFTTSANGRILAHFYENGSIDINPNIALVFAYPTEIESPISFTNYRPEIQESISKRVNHTNNFIVTVFLTGPRSIGSVTLKSNSPRDFPLLNPNILKECRDIESLYRGIQWALEEIAEQGKLFGTKFTPFLPINDCDHLEFGTKNFWYCAIQQLATPSSFATSTVRMGPPSDSLAVVDNLLQVYGVKNLRVVDYAVVPVNTNANGATVGFVIGERAAVILKNRYI